VTVDVTAAVAGNYINSLPAGALHTSVGSNAAPAVATLTVNPVSTPGVVAPTLGKSFSPATINAGGVSTLTITLGNANGTPASLTGPLIDILPSGLVVVPGTISSTCIEFLNAPTGLSRSPAWFVIDTDKVGLMEGAIPANGSCTVTAQVTAAVGGSYHNSLPAGALQTNNGNNAALAVATLTVNSPAAVAPTLGKSFSPATINAGGVSTLTIILSNTNATAATLTAPLIDSFPSGVVIAANPRTSCGGMLSTPSTAGLFATVVLTGGSIPANGFCAMTVGVTAAVAGNYINSLPAGALQTSNGNNADPAVATLTVN